MAPPVLPCPRTALLPRCFCRHCHFRSTPLLLSTVNQCQLQIHFSFQDAEMKVSSHKNYTQHRCGLFNIIYNDLKKIFAICNGTIFDIVIFLDRASIKEMLTLKQIAYETNFYSPKLYFSSFIYFKQ